MHWFLLAIVSAFSNAIEGLSIKGGVRHGSVLVVASGYRLIAGSVLLCGAYLMGGFTISREFLVILAITIPLEIGGIVSITAALKAGDLSLVMPLKGLTPLMVVLTGFLILGITPHPMAGIGIFAVAVGIYVLGVKKGYGLLDPLRALKQEKATWWMMACALFWGTTTVLHKIGLEHVGPLGWSGSLSITSAVMLAIPALLYKGKEPIVRKGEGKSLLGWLMLAGFAGAGAGGFMVMAIALTQPSYVSAVKSFSVVLGVFLGVLLFRERTDWKNRIAGGVLVTLGIVIIGLFG